MNQSIGFVEIDEIRAKLDLGILYKYKVQHYKASVADWKDPSSISTLYSYQQTGKVAKLVDDYSASGPSHLPKWTGSLYVQTSDNKQFVMIVTGSASKGWAKNAVFAAALAALCSNQAKPVEQPKYQAVNLDFLIRRDQEQSDLEYVIDAVHSLATEDECETYVRWTLTRVMHELQQQISGRITNWPGIYEYIDAHQVVLERAKVDEALQLHAKLTDEEKFMLKFVLNGKMSATMLTPATKDIYDIFVALISQEERNRLMHAINGNGEIEANFENVLLSMDFTDFDAAMGADWCAYVEAFINTVTSSGYSEAKAAQHNKEMHSMNGNIRPKSDTPIKAVKKIEQVAKKLTKEEKKVLNQEKAKVKLERATARKAKRETIGAAIKGTNRSVIRRPELSKTVRKGASIYARAIALPLNMKPVRWFDMYNTFATGCLSLKNRRKVTVSSNSPGTPNDLLPPGDVLSFHFRSILAHNIVYQWRSSAWAYGVNWINSDGNYVLNGSSSTFSTTVSEPHVLKTVTATDKKVGGIDGPHGTTWYAGARSRDELARMFYLSIGQTIQLTGTTTISDVWEIQLCHYSDGELAIVDQDVVTFGPSPQTATVTAPYGDYYCIRLRCQGASGLHTLTIDAINIESDASVATTYAHRPMPDVEKLFSQIEESRIVAFAGMISNTAAEAWKNGSVYTTQAAGGKSWQDWVTNPSQAISSTSNFYSDVAQKGVYAFCKPVGPEDFDFAKEFLKDASGNIIDSFWDLTFSKDYLVLYLSSPDVQGRAVDISSGGFIEYKSVTQVTAFDVTSMKEADHNLAMQELRSMVNYSANENHITKVFSQIAEYGTQAWRFYKQNKGVIDAAAEALASFFI